MTCFAQPASQHEVTRFARKPHPETKSRRRSYPPAKTVLSAQAAHVQVHSLTCCKTILLLQEDAQTPPPPPPRPRLPPARADKRKPIPPGPSIDPRRHREMHILRRDISQINSPRPHLLLSAPPQHPNSTILFRRQPVSHATNRVAALRSRSDRSAFRYWK